MKIRDIQVDGFGVWSGLSVDAVPEGMTLFYGPNEAGKTTLMQFVRAMLYGFTPERRARYLPPIHGGTPGGALRVTGPGGGYEIRRRAQLTDPDSVGQLSVTGADGLSQGQHRLGSLLGQIDESIFKNVFAIGLRELQELSTLDDTAAADELYKLSSGLDRVSLVDCIRSLKSGRQQLIGKTVGKQALADDAEIGRLQRYLRKRDTLRDEVDSLTRQGRRWSELASQRHLQQQEVGQLLERVGRWENDAKTIEVAISVHDLWTQKSDLKRRLVELQTDQQVADDAPAVLARLEAQLAERRERLEETKQKRRELREKAQSLPINPRMSDLQGRIEAAGEQATWIAAVQEQIESLDEQIAKAQQQLDVDAEKVGLSEDERVSLREGKNSALPDLSRASMATLADPARAVKEQTFILRQARNEGLRDKQEVEQLEEKLGEVLNHVQGNDLQAGLKQQAEAIALIRRCVQTEEHLEKLKRHYRDLEKESLDLATDQALPVERTILLFLPFVLGGMSFLYGLFHLFRWTAMVAQPSNNTGMLCILFGILALGWYYFIRERGDKGTTLDLEDCERQIDTLRQQIREVESERDGLIRKLPPGNGTLETRLREAEELLVRLESALPAYHSHLAAKQRMATSRKRAESASTALTRAREHWQHTLEQLGLSENLTPSSIRSMSENYETLLADRRRVQELQSERALRERELQTLARRIETLYLEAMGTEEEVNGSMPGDDLTSTDKSASRRERPQKHSVAPGSIPEPTSAPPKLTVSLRKDPLSQLNQLNEELARQHHWIKRRRELVQQDQQYKRQQAALLRNIERTEQNRRSLWAKSGVATGEHFDQLVERKKQSERLEQQLVELQHQFLKMIGTHVEADAVIAQLENSKASELETRWDRLTQQITQAHQRVDALRVKQGELSQEMKQLADDRRLATAQLELGCVERQIESLAQRWQTLAMTSFLLEDVCRTVENERQPETLREASSFLTQLTDGKYVRIWTPLGTNRLNIDTQEGRALPLEVLSRGTREAIFIALRLALAASYARRGVMLPLVLDDVLVNFDRGRALQAARTLQTFAQLGHQVLMFTCHEHIANIFHEIGEQVRLLPQQGVPGAAAIMDPPEVEEYEEEYEEQGYDSEHDSENEVELEPVSEEEPEPEPVLEVEPEPEPVLKREPEPEPVLEVRSEPKPEPEPEPVLVMIPPVPPQPQRPVVPVQPSRPRPLPPIVQPTPVVPFVEASEPPSAPAIDWLWYERDLERPVAQLERMESDGLGDKAEADAHATWIESEPDEAPPAAPEDVWDRSHAWWAGQRPPR